MPRRGTSRREGAGWLPLTTGAVDGRAACDSYRLQRTPAREAGLARAPVDEQLLLLPAQLAPGVAIGLYGAAAVGDRDLQRLTQRLMQALRGPSADAARDPGRARTGAVQRLVRVDVAHAGDRLLVQQHGLERRPSAPKRAVKLVRFEGGVDRFRAQSRHLLRRQQGVQRAREQAAKAPRVAVAQFASVVESEDGVRVFLEGCGRVDDAQLARHAEVDDQHNRVGQMQVDVLAPPCHRLDAHARHRVDELLRLGMADDRWKREVAAHDGAPDEMRTQVRDDRLDFRELRHQARTTASLRTSAQLGPTFISTSIPVSSSYAPVITRGTRSAN